MSKYPEYKTLNLPDVAAKVLKSWAEKDIFNKSVSSREGKESFVFYEGPPSANGLPGIHHVMARTIKDIFCRYHTMKGKQVKRKAGWDTHGLPIELAVEKTLGITKEDIGKKITVEEYNKACRKEVMKYTDKWEDLTRMMGYWVDMQNPYITYDNKYIESVWWLLKNIYDKKLLYKGYTIQPYSPAAGTGLSSHELNQPGCYRNVKDRTATVQFKLKKTQELKTFIEMFAIENEFQQSENITLLAWTTTPWTLPSNTALAVGKKIEYAVVLTYNPFTHKKTIVILANDLKEKFFPVKNSEITIEEYKPGDKSAPYKILTIVKGENLERLSYEQLLPFVQPEGDAFKVVCGDFVTTDDGTGIVHIAPSFGADDFKVAKENNIASLTLVDKRGKFLPEVCDGVFLYGDEYVKEAYLTEEEKKSELEKQKNILESKGKIKELKEYLSVDERIILKLQEEGKLFKKETYEHSYPHCWRTDKPILYYPLDSWFIKITSVKDRLFELNKSINWKPESTGTGRFGNWLENANDWNLSRSRFWGIPLPVWRTEDGAEEICIGSVEELKKELDKSVAKGFMKSNPLASFIPGNNTKENYDTFDLHKPYADDYILASPSGNKMYRENDLIDVWFDSGAMPYAQLHYPFENKNEIDNKTYFPADFIAEGVDQTRGWFYTLHAIAGLCFDTVAYKNVVSNGLVLDKNGNKMSKRLGNAIDPFDALKKYGPDSIRWYMVTNAQPWDNLKFDISGVEEVQRKYFGTLFNTYAFFAIYANIDGFKFSEAEIPFEERPEIDRWILSELNTLIKTVDSAYSEYEPTKAGRAIEYFLDEHLSNWYVRLCRRRFWKGEYSSDKIAAYQTLYVCLETIALLSAPIAPFFSDMLYVSLNSVTQKQNAESVHLALFPKANEKTINKDLEDQMEMAQKISSLVLSLRKKEKIRVRQPLGKIMVPVLGSDFRKKLEKVSDLILAEVNVKALDFLTDTEGVLVKKIKPNFKTLGPKVGKNMKTIAALIAAWGQKEIAEIEQKGQLQVQLNGNPFVIDITDTEITSQDIPGWQVASEGRYTVALDITISEALKEEGMARELVNRIQNLRKEMAFDVTDRIEVFVKKNAQLDKAISNNLNYICAEVLASKLELVGDLDSDAEEVEVDEKVKTLIKISKLN